MPGPKPPYRVGQILFVIPDSNPSVVPILVVEKRVSETIDGAQTMYLYKSPKKDVPPKPLDTIKGVIYTSLDDVRRIMLHNSQRAIDQMISKAEEIARDKLGVKQQRSRVVEEESDLSMDADLRQAQPTRQLPPPSMLDDLETEIELPDGTMARVQLQSGGD